MEIALFELKDLGTGLLRGLVVDVHAIELGDEVVEMLLGAMLERTHCG